MVGPRLAWGKESPSLRRLLRAQCYWAFPWLVRWCLEPNMRWLRAALPVGILTVLLVLIAATFRPQADPGFVENGLTCLKNGLTYAIPGGSLFWLLVRRGAIP